jgi:hypothetical protein
VTTQGVIALDVIGCTLLVWILDPVRRDRLYVGYAVLLGLTIVGAIIVLSVPEFITIASRLASTVFPTSALTLLTLCFIFAMLVYVLTQVTLLSNRVATVIQRLAIQRAHAPMVEEPSAAVPDPE